MASRSIKLPDIGEGVAAAEVVEWHVKVGDAVREDQIIAAVMTDKATVEIPSPADGIVTALGVEAGQVLSVGAELLRLDVGGDAESAPDPGIVASDEVKAAERATEGADLSDLEPAAEGLEPKRPAAAAPEPRRPAQQSKHPPPGSWAPRPLPRAVPSGPPRPPGEKPIASPAVRRRALEAGVDLRQVRGSGPADRITHDDLDAFLRGGNAVGPVPSGLSANTAVEEVKVIGLRRRIAQKMADAKRRAAHFSYVEEVDVTALEELRTTLNTRFGGTRPKLTMTPFLVQALVRADFPQMNALYDDEAEVIHRYGGIHVGVATQTPSGLMVPVLRHAEARDLWDCAAEVKRLTDSARKGLASRDELTGSTITITSLGALGGIASTPVLNRPEVAIIGVNKQVMRPVWRDGSFVPRLIMNLSSSFDHRVVDGYDAALFIQAIKGLLETPAMLFMEP